MAKSFLMMKYYMLFSLFLHHLSHAFATFRITDGDEIDACRKLRDVDAEGIALARNVS